MKIARRNAFAIVKKNCNAFTFPIYIMFKTIRDLALNKFVKKNLNAT